MLISSTGFCFRRSKFTTRVILIVLVLVLLQSLYVLKISSPVEDKEEIDLSYGDIDISNTENEVNEDLKEIINPVVDVDKKKGQILEPIGEEEEDGKSKTISTDDNDEDIGEGNVGIGEGGEEEINDSNEDEVDEEKYAQAQKVDDVEEEVKEKDDYYGLDKEENKEEAIYGKNPYTPLNNENDDNNNDSDNRNDNENNKNENNDNSNDNENNENEDNDNSNDNENNENENNDNSNDKDNDPEEEEKVSDDQKNNLETIESKLSGDLINDETKPNHEGDTEDDLLNKIINENINSEEAEHVDMDNQKINHNNENTISKDESNNINKLNGDSNNLNNNSNSNEDLKKIINNKVENKKVFNKDNKNGTTKPKGWKLDPAWEWCRNISIVYTWVNGSDPHHQELKSHYNGGIKKVDQRDRSMDELRYSLRSLEMNLPWHEGMIYIVSPNQVPSWLKTENPRIKVIDQDTMLPPSVTPTFNSFAIEFYLDKIPGLTEIFIQLNDDYFFKKYIHPSFFFNRKKNLNFFYGRTHVSKGFSAAYQIANIKTPITWLKKYWGSIFFTNGVLQEKYGDENHLVMLQHAPYVWYRDVFEPMRQFYGQYISNTLSHKFRHPLDLIPTYAHQHYIINVASKPGYSVNEHKNLHPELDLDFGFYPHTEAPQNLDHYGYRPLSRNAVRKYIRFGTVLDDKEKSMRLFNIIRNGPYLMFNLNDDYTKDEPAQWLLDFMNEMFPQPSSFELPN